MNSRTAAVAPGDEDAAATAGERVLAVAAVAPSETDRSAASPKAPAIVLNLCPDHDELFI